MGLLGTRRCRGQSVASKGLDEDLHTTVETQYKVKDGLLLNVVVSMDRQVCCRGNTLMVFRGET